MILIGGVAASLFLFWYLHLLTLNQMTQLSLGLDAGSPDGRLLGGVRQRAADKNGRERPQAAQLYHKTAGTLFPIIFGFSWLLLIGINVANRVLRGLLWALLLLFIIIPSSANVAINTALAAQAWNPPPCFSHPPSPLPAGCCSC